jgi:hypothetical protein
MKTLLKLLMAICLLGCQDNCDLSHYPSPPYSAPYHVEYSDGWVKYIYICYDGSYNEIITYQVVGGCWEALRSTQYNINCN